MAVLLSACGTTEPATPSPGKPQNTVGGVLKQPLVDLNITSVEIPPLLVEAAKAPYAPAQPNDCEGIDHEIAALTDVLGPDLTPATEDGTPILSREAAGDAAWGAARGAASGWIPFRGVVRYVTGAERSDQRARDAVLAGFVRRAYLRGLRAPLQCDAAPAATEE